LAIDHYENFPVASQLLSKSVRQAMHTVYEFARSADDIADSLELSESFKRERLQFYRDELICLENNEAAATHLFNELGKIIRDFHIPTTHFYWLLDAFEQDLTVSRYLSFTELEKYCQKSANPVGRIVLHIFGEPTEEQFAASDRICTSLQLINFMQDVQKDLELGRIYIPEEEMKEFGVSERHIRNGIFDLNWINLMTSQITRIKQYLDHGSVLTHLLSGRHRTEIKAIVKSAERVVFKIEKNRGNVFHANSRLSVWDGVLIALKTLLKT
jgi:squalene synthase HpnC